MSTFFDVIHAPTTNGDRYPADARFDDASVAPTREELAEDRRDGAPRTDAERTKKEEDKELEKALKDSFPASDPVSIANGTVAGAPDPASGKAARKSGRTNEKPPAD